MLYAWLSIGLSHEDIDAMNFSKVENGQLDMEEYEQCGGYPYSIQEKFGPCATAGDLSYLIRRRLGEMGVQAENYKYVRGSNTQGRMLDDRGRWTGLLWMVYPCYGDGRNIDVDPVEPRGE